MPTVTVAVEDFRNLLHLPPLDKKYVANIIKKYTPPKSKKGDDSKASEEQLKKLPPIDPTHEPHKEIYDRLTEYGLDLDSVVVENGILMYKIDVPANRPDLLCAESISLALRAFRGEIHPKFHLTEPQLEIHFEESVREVRPFVMCAVLRNVHFTETSYKSFIDFQDKLHQNLARRRTLAAIGTHDLDHCKPPFYFRAEEPSSIKFVPLTGGPEVDGPTLYENLTHHQQLSTYLDLIKDLPVWPVIRDSEGNVCSMPPIINSDLTKITTSTTNVFIDCTAMDYTRGMQALVALSAAFATYGISHNEGEDTIFEIEPVRVISPEGDVDITPAFSPVDFKVSCDYIRTISGLHDISRDAIKSNLHKMMLEVEDDGPDGLLVHAPATRTDILHPCDIAEDFCIAYGYNNIDHSSRRSIPHGKLLPMNELCDRLRAELGCALFVEETTFSLVSQSENFDKQLLPRTKAVHVKNAQTAKLEIARTNLLGGLLKSAHAIFNQPNIKRPVPLRLFEVNDVVLVDDNTETGAKNYRRLCAIVADTKSQFGEIHGLLNRFAVLVNAKEGEFKLQREDCPTCITGQRAAVIFRGKSVGWIGVVHPQVLLNFKLTTPIAALEIDIAPFLQKPDEHVEEEEKLEIPDRIEGEKFKRLVDYTDFHVSNKKRVYDAKKKEFLKGHQEGQDVIVALKQVGIKPSARSVDSLFAQYFAQKTEEHREKEEMVEIPDKQEGEVFKQLVDYTDFHISNHKRVYNAKTKRFLKGYKKGDDVIIALSQLCIKPTSRTVNSLYEQYFN